MSMLRKSNIVATILRVVVPLAVTIGLCWLMFAHIDYRQMLDIIRQQCSFGWILLGLAFSVLSHVIRAYRWRIQLVALGINPPPHIVVDSIFGTYAVNLVFPRLGEIWRCGYIAKRQKSDFSTVFGSMVAERLADTVTVALIMLAAFLFASSAILSYISQNREAYEHILHLVTSPWLWAAGVLAVLVLVFLLRHKSKSGSILDKLQSFIKGLWQGFASIATMPGKGRWLAYTLALWGCYFVQMYVMFYAFPFTAGVISQYGIGAVLVTFGISSLAMGVPSNGGIGPWQFAVIFALSLYGVDKTDAAAYANLVMGCNTLLLILLGFYTFIALYLDRKN